MNSKPIKTPGPDHPITITPTKGRVTAKWKEATAAAISALGSRQPLVALRALR